MSLFQYVVYDGDALRLALAGETVDGGGLATGGE